MKYELDKQLKDAGFPVSKEPHCGGCECDLISGDITLSELIEVCVKDMTARNIWQNTDRFHFFELAPNLNLSGEIDAIGKVAEWRATWSTGNSLDDVGWINNYFGTTPTEAVAKLWLALNEHK